MRRVQTSFLGVAFFALVFSCNSGPRADGGTLDTGVEPLRLATPRKLLPFVPLEDGRVLAAGGHDGQRTLSSCEVFEPETGMWSLTGSMHKARRNHAVVRLLDGRVLVTGGTQVVAPGALADAEVYAPASGLWTQVAPMFEARNDPSALLLPDGRVLVAGGTDADRRPLRSAELFDPMTGTWAPATPPGFVRGGAGTAVMLAQGKALFVSGLQAELYDVATGRWEKAGFAGGAAGTHRQGHSVTLLPDGRVLVVGGGTARASSTAEVYDAVTGLWTLVAAPSVAREHHAAVVTPEGQVLVLGGEHPMAGALASVERFDPMTGQWASAPALTEPRGLPGALTLRDGSVLLVGGANEVAGMLDTSEQYLPTGCVPVTCETREATCGAVPDGCGGMLECAPCVVEGCDAQQCSAEGLTRR
ncbi:galactose oxidase [Myxococcus llanfairpwllgwyngyllgogerychwyrndrobwllllantysiliogogogochensis]|uniref:Galactose oxidase n=1 Tax=Myxococcus llanfairpwllgwyngyllgogerychwyrndrobwllllantysiliogogogochensis TaxID=2590453 RepID=A0A540WIK7_9BACT|nr:kelch repeat-containing protein [Myxococcus llanfairpwllgwyngyllgogerychwyrndrobwllllantysiliogogogochensis]TQF08813.1 galactose oxidase [Myxococcus llanfairpwllgwyngyllgogerychwyrndrobwllllantysiliogogogochensis]